ncbi:MAG: helix-turn-helix transcriptional regulator [Propionibacteriaceae bacterium]|nr:helix-turn-helix transcriptional regulator [Propionibacteriaceae bacterium]
MPSALVPPPTRADFATTDTDEAEAFLRDLRGTTVRLEGLRPGRPLRHRLAGIGAVTVSTIDYPPKLGVSTHPLGAPVVVEVLSGRMDRAHRPDDRRYAVGDLTIFGHLTEAAAGVFHDATIRSTMVQPAMFSQLITGPTLAPIRFTDLDPISPTAAAAWRRTCAYVRRLMEDDEIIRQPLILDAATRLLAAAILTTFPNTAVLEPTAIDRHDAHPAMLRRAMAYIEANATSPITVTDIAEASYVSVRALQLGFRRHLETTPMAYLRRVRLAGAHEDLISADPSTTTITEIANRWGFVDQSRFSAAYRQAYGRTPRETLRGSGRSAH